MDPGNLRIYLRRHNVNIDQNKCDLNLKLGTYMILSDGSRNEKVVVCDGYLGVRLYTEDV